MTESSKIFQQRQEKKWIERCRIGKSVLYQKGNERKVVHPDREDLHFTAPDKPLTHETIYQAPKKAKKPKLRPKKQPKHTPSQRPGGKRK